MTITRNRVEVEADLAHALSRHIGYTSAAYDLERIVSVLEAFEGNPSVYEPEITLKLKINADEKAPERGASSRYLSEVVNFAVSMGIIESVSAKGSQISKYAPTMRGRALMASKSLEDQEFYRFFLTKTVLLSDADSIFCLLSYYSSPSASSQKLTDYYKSFHDELRETRLDWLVNAFPVPVLLRRIADQISWLKPSRESRCGYGIDTMAAKTARHHSTPRKGWISHLGMYDGGLGQLTDLGSSIQGSLMMDEKYFWLGPNSEAQDNLKIDVEHQRKGPYVDTFDFADDSKTPSDNNVIVLADDTAEIMHSGFAAAKLIHAPQAPLELPIEYIKYRRYVEKVAYDWRTVLNYVFKQNRESLQRLSARVGEIGFYKSIAKD